MSHLRWEREEKRPRHPYRDTAIFYAVLAGMIVLVTALTNGNMFPGEVENKTRILRFIGEIGAVPVAAAFFVVSTGFSWWRLRKRERQRPQKERP
jgi:hypothetical protein